MELRLGSLTVIDEILVNITAIMPRMPVLLALLVSILTEYCNYQNICDCAHYCSKRVYGIDIRSIC